MMHIADNQDALLEYLYDEGDPAGRVAIAKHLQECTACSVAVLEFQTVRGMLKEWAPPASPLGFRIVQDVPRAADTSRSRRVARGWAQGLAAAALFAAGMAVSSQLHVEYADGALTVRPRSAVPPREARTASIQLTPSQLTPLREPPPANSAPAQSATPPAADDMLQRVRAMIAESETRQQRELALRLAQVAREVDTQHRADLVRIQQNLGQMEMETGAQIDQQRQLMDYLVRTSGGAK